MTPRPDPDPQDEALLLDDLQGRLGAEAQADLARRLAREPDLANARAAWQRLFDAEQAVFEPATQMAAAHAEGVRLAAWIRSRVRAQETAAARARFGSTRRRAWSRVLAWSVGLHVVVLGVLALLAGGESPALRSDDAARVALEEGTWGEIAVDPAETALAFRYERIAWEDLGAVGDRIALGEQETLGESELRDDLASLDPARPIAWDGLSHPVGVVVPMTRRKNAALKRRRLDLLGFNASGTLLAVDRGLRFLRRRQAEDGSFPAGGGRGALEQTSLTLLAFLGDGHTSRGRSDRDLVVQRSVGWLRRQLFPGGASLGPAARGDALAPATVALCEDYMLSYGDLPPAAAQRRAGEIAALADRARSSLGRAEGSDRTWCVWALDAAARAGVIETTAADQRTFREWVEAAAATAGDAGDAMGALSAGTALLFAERGLEKPRFLSWSGSHAESLVARLAPTGRARDGDAIGDTALILLALQVAYRTY